MQELGKMIITLGMVLVGIGLLMSILGKIPFIGKLPGDILIKKENFTFYAPVATSIIVSILLTLILNIFFSAKR